MICHAPHAYNIAFLNAIPLCRPFRSGYLSCQQLSPLLRMFACLSSNSLQTLPPPVAIRFFSMWHLRHTRLADVTSHIDNPPDIATDGEQVTRSSAICPLCVVWPDRWPLLKKSTLYRLFASLPGCFAAHFHLSGCVRFVRNVVGDANCSFFQHAFLALCNLDQSTYGFLVTLRVPYRGSDHYNCPFMEKNEETVVQRLMRIFLLDEGRFTWLANKRNLPCLRA